MARFVLVSNDGRMEVQIEGEPGEELSPDQTMAYYHMFAAHSLGQIAEQLEGLANRVSDLADVVEQSASA